MFTRFRVAIVTALALSTVLVGAQTLRLRGTIQAVDIDALRIGLGDGATARLVLAQNATVVAVIAASLADIREGSYIGSAAVPQADGTQRALEVHIFPEEMRGAGEGHRPYAPVPQATMTNGAMAGSAVTGVDGTTITVAYRGGAQKIVVSPDVPIVRYVIGSLADLKPGARFTAAAATLRADGSYETARISVGRDGAVPQ